MTIGQRIAQKRKEQDLSQEVLGEILGVSRQAIYKWESDASLPEIDKLVALSKLFGVTVGWLLGVEDAPTEAAAQDGAIAPGETGGNELTEAQLQMAEEIAKRYLDAAEDRKKSPWGRWEVRTLFVLCGIMLAFLLSLRGQVQTLDSRYTGLQSSVCDIRDNLSSKLNALSSQVEETLKKQSSLVSDSGAEIAYVNLKENRIVFDVYAVPKTYSRGMQVMFQADDGTGGIQRTSDVLENGGKYSATLACQLTDSIRLSAIFVSADGTRSIQLLETYAGLSTDTVPQVDVEDFASYMDTAVTDGALSLPETYLSVRPQNTNPSVYAVLDTAGIQSVAVGLFQNQKLVAWAKSCPQPGSFSGDYPAGTQFFRLPEIRLTLRPTDKLEWAALVTDEYGRRSICGGSVYILDQDSAKLTWPNDSSIDSDVSHWTFS